MSRRGPSVTRVVARPLAERLAERKARLEQERARLVASHAEELARVDAALAELAKVERAISPALEQVYTQLVSLRLVDPRED